MTTGKGQGAERLRTGVEAVRLLDESGQTFTEYVMILGLLTAMIISLTAVIVPGLGQAVAGLVHYMLVYMGSPNS